MGMCGGPKWKREEVADHKVRSLYTGAIWFQVLRGGTLQFDFLDTTEFHDKGWFMRLK